MTCSPSERSGTLERVIDALDIDLAPVVAEQPYPVLFATVSGAHLYGFPSRDSDVDLRGVHLLPAADPVGLREPEETRSRMWDRDGVEMDLVTHDLRNGGRGTRRAGRAARGPCSSACSTSGECRHSRMFGFARRASSQKRSSSHPNCSSAGPSTEGTRTHDTGVDRVVTHQDLRQRRGLGGRRGQRGSRGLRGRRGVGVHAGSVRGRLTPGGPSFPAPRSAPRAAASWPDPAPPRHP